MKKILIDIEEFERKMNEDTPLLDSEGNPQRFPINDNEILIFYNWIQEHKEELKDVHIPDKYQNMEWLIKIKQLEALKQKQEEEIKDSHFVHSFRSAVLTIMGIFITLALLFLYKLIIIIF